MQPVRVIINADDLGVSPLANRRTFALIERGAVTSATIMANGPSFPEAMDLARAAGPCSFGVHLNITWGPPLTDPAGLGPLLGPDRHFRPGHLKDGWPLGVYRQVYREFCAQIERVIEAGIRPSHLDTHHHAHNHPKVLAMLKLAQRTYRIPGLRLSKNFYFPQGPPLAKLALKRAYNLTIRRLVGSRCTDYFTDLPDFFHAARARRLEGTFELMVHPELLHHQEEMALLDRDWWEEIGQPIQRISYWDL